MVTYQTLTKLSFEIAKQQGQSVNQPYAAELISATASVWRTQPDRIKQMTEDQARSLLRSEIDYTA